MNPKLIALLNELEISKDLRRRFEAVYSQTVAGDETNDRSVNVKSNRLGKYTDLGLLGRGGMAEVRRVQDPDLNRRLAMKIIDDGLMGQGSGLTRFVNEAQTLSQLQQLIIAPFMK